MAFQYQLAWRECAFPEYEKLPEIMKKLYEVVCEVSSEISQGPDLRMPWAGGLLAAFESAETTALAKASRVVHDFGHWSETGDSYRGNGGTWKFSNYADQALNTRFGLPIEPKHGYGLLILQGALRLTFLSSRVWRWRELELPCEESVRELKELISRANDDHLEYDKVVDLAFRKLDSAGRWFRDYTMAISEFE